MPGAGEGPALCQQALEACWKAGDRMRSIVDPKWQLFVKVAELGSLSRAATATDVPQSMISRHLATLERECGARLFRRTGRGVVLTEFGEQIFPRIHAMIGEAQLLADDIRTSGGVPSGEVRVGLLPSTVPLVAHKLFDTVRQRFPRIRLHLTEGSSALLQELLQEGRIDMALLSREEDQVLRDEPVLQRHSMRVVGLVTDPLLQQPSVRFRDLENLPLVLPSPPHPLRARLEQLAREMQLSLNMAIDADSMRLQHTIAAAGGGYAITGGLLGTSDLNARLKAVPIVEPSLMRTIVLGTTVRRPHTLATREVYQQMLLLSPCLKAGDSAPLQD